MPVDASSAAQARERIGALAKPPHSLGRLESLGEQLAAIAGTCPPPLPDPARIVVVAGDHGVVAQGVTRWPSALSGVLAATVATGGAGVTVLAGWPAPRCGCWTPGWRSAWTVSRRR